MENSDTKQFDPELVDAVRKQIEYYFSKENLQSDAYLTSQMDAQMSVPISVVMKFAKLKALTQDEAVVRHALIDSSVTIIDNRIKANIKATGRSTIILREIPSDASEDEVKEIFNYDGCKRISSIRSDIGDTWFVTMESEEDAKDTALDLRLKKRTFRGQPVKARIKTEPVVRSFYPVTAPVAPVPPVYPPLHLPFPPVVPNPMMDLSNFGYLPVPPVLETASLNVESTEAVSTEVTANTSSEDKDTVVEGDSDKTAAEEGTDATKSVSRSRDSRKAPTRSSTERRKPESRKPVTPSHGKDSKDKKTVEGVPSKPPIEVNALNFPPLQGMEDTPVPTPGYKDTYHKYNFDAIIAIVKSVKEAKLPAELNLVEHSLALSATPNMDLLKRQRTFSIDETREQLRQGRPVQREAIISGAVDYRSLMFGDDHEQQKHAAVAPKAADLTAASSSAANTSTASAASEIVVKTTEPTATNTATSKETEVETKSLPASPQRISASTWAAMVKSSAQAALENPNRSQSSSKTPPNDQKKAIVSPPKDESENRAEKDKGTPSRANKSQEVEKDRDLKKSHNRSERRRQRDHENKTSNSEQESKVGEDGVTKADNHEEKNATGAWGKSSFASVLRQALPEDSVEESKKHSSATETTQNSSHSPLKLNSRGNALKENSHHERGNHRGAGRSHRDREKRDAYPRREGNQDHHNNSHHNKRITEEKDIREVVMEK